MNPACQLGAMEYSSPPCDLDAVRRYWLGRVREALAARDLAGIVLCDPLNIRYAVDATNMQIWCTHNEVRHLYVPTEGPVRLFKNGRRQPALLTKSVRVPPFKWVNTTPGNIEIAITRTYRKIGPTHADRYLASFAWRHNRRYQLETTIPRVVHNATRTDPMPHRVLVAR